MDVPDGFRDREVVQALARRIDATARRIGAGPAGRTLTFMEVCGTHTMAMHRFGLHALLPDGVRLLSGPGCPVCVTPNRLVDTAIAYARLNDVTLMTFGDMLKVPGSTSSLSAEKSRGRDVRLVYSPTDAVEVARANPERRIVFFAIGFETTTPTCAAAVLAAREAALENFFVVSAGKLLPPALEALATGEVRIDGFVCPGHVSVVTGFGIYRDVVEKHHIPCVITGFEPVDMLKAVLMLTEQVAAGEARIENEYNRVVRPEGNPIAQQVMAEVFVPVDSEWRGIGMIPASGLAVREVFSAHDALRQLPVEVEPPREHKGCICGAVLRGARTPLECTLFATACTPAYPVGACMVSSEGTCAAYYKYGKDRPHVAPRNVAP
ncbi:MAG: hydrogenase formation protein HypD [Verrucomicrobia bacterium]|nr:hydrogenase formation protein HypD [Verrucomicrobiota bacterium]